MAYHHLLSIEAPIEPIGKARARFVGHVYTPRRTSEFERTIGFYARTAMRGKLVFEQALRVTLTAVFTIPRSWPKAKRAAALAGEIGHTSKPDQDNVEKAVLDACNAIVWHDDAQIVDCRTLKLWGEGPLVRVEVAQAISSRQRIVQELANRIVAAHRA